MQKLMETQHIFQIGEMIFLSFLKVHGQCGGFQTTTLNVSNSNRRRKSRNKSKIND